MSLSVIADSGTSADATGDNVVHNYIDREASWDFEFDVEPNGVLKIFKFYADTSTKRELVAAYPKGYWTLVRDMSL